MAAGHRPGPDLLIIRGLCCATEGFYGVLVKYSVLSTVLCTLYSAGTGVSLYCTPCSVRSRRGTSCGNFVFLRRGCFKGSARNKDSSQVFADLRILRPPTTFVDDGNFGDALQKSKSCILVYRVCTSTEYGVPTYNTLIRTDRAQNNSPAWQKGRGPGVEERGQAAGGRELRRGQKPTAYQTWSDSGPPPTPGALNGALN